MIEDYEKEELRHMIRKEVLHYMGSDFRAEISRWIEQIGREYLIQELKKLDIPQVLRDKFEELLAINMQPVITEAYKHVNKRLRKSFTIKVRDLCNLKTSDLQEVRDAVLEQRPARPQDIKNDLLEHFPEYAEAIKKLPEEI